MYSGPDPEPIPSGGCVSLGSGTRPEHGERPMYSGPDPEPISSGGCVSLGSGTRPEHG